MRVFLKKGITVIFLLLFLPYAILLLFNGKEGIHLEESLDELEYQVYTQMLQEDFSWMEDGTLALMAILYRSECLRQEEVYHTNTNHSYLQQELGNKTEQRIFEAVKQTKGQVITIDGDYKELPYHLLCAGKTRNGILLGEEYNYVKSVPCLADIQSENYLQIAYFSRKELLNALEVDILSEELIVKRDSTEYVSQISCGEKIWEGEEFRKQLHLSSSCFFVEQEGEKLRIVAKGCGHGFGISLYTANEMILEGNSLEEVFQYFYEGARCISLS